MILYIFGTGHGADEILEDSDFYIGNVKTKFDNKIFVEDNPQDKDTVSTEKYFSFIENFDDNYSGIADFKDCAIISAWSPKRHRCGTI